jgi:hypothetical protein
MGKYEQKTEQLLVEALARHIYNFEDTRRYTK